MAQGVAELQSVLTQRAVVSRDGSRHKTADEGSSYPAARACRMATQRQGYRLDWMLERKDGDGGLQTQDGYWVGEVGFEKSQAAQGLRYRMRPTSQEIKNKDEAKGYIYQIGPFKMRMGEVFGG